MKRLILNAAFALLALLPITAQSHEPDAHVHGLATLQIAVDDHVLTIDFSSPLDNLLGFEHMPANEKEKAAVQSMEIDLNKANLVFIPTAEAQCVLKSVNLESPVISKKSKASTSGTASHEPGAASQVHDEEAGHADLDGEFIFNCADTKKLRDLQVKLFQRYPHLHQIKAETISSRGQSATTLTADKHSVSW